MLPTKYFKYYQGLVKKCKHITLNGETDKKPHPGYIQTFVVYYKVDILFPVLLYRTHLSNHCLRYTMYILKNGFNLLSYPLYIITKSYISYIYKTIYFKTIIYINGNGLVVNQCIILRKTFLFGITHGGFCYGNLMSIHVHNICKFHVP